MGADPTQPNPAELPLLQRMLSLPPGLGKVSGRASGFKILLVAEWIHFTLFGIISPTMKPKVYTFGGL